MNSEQAQKCIEVAKAAISRQDWDKVIIRIFPFQAERFLNKCINMGENAEASELLDTVKKLSRLSTGTTKTTQASQAQGAQKEKKAQEQAQEEEKPKYTKEDVILLILQKG